ncbi:response regulator [Xanthobacteraceae bacterium A53D]
MANSRASWLANLSLQWKFALVLSFITVLVLILFSGNIVAIRESERAQGEAQELVALINETNLTARALNRRQTSLVRAVFVRTDINMRMFQEAVSDVDAHLAKLREMTLTEPVLRTAADRATSLNERWPQVVAGPMAALAERAARGSVAGTERDDALETFLSAETGPAGSRAMIGILDQLSAAAGDQLNKSRDELDRQGTILSLINLIALVAILVASIAAFYLTSRIIARPLRNLAELMERLAEHDHSIVVPHLNRRDEVGIIGRALNVFREMSIATYDNDWVKTGIAEVSSRMQRAEDFRTFASSLLSDLSPRLNAGVGVFYAFHEDRQTLELLGSYGYTERKHVSTTYKLGEGLVGQCGAERKAIVLTPVPDDYVRIHSGTGEASPRSVFVLPIVAKDRLLGVLELASFEPFAGRRQTLLEEAADIIGLSLDNLVRALRTRELLEQSQRQSAELRAAEEELRVQQEELRTTNEQLQQQSQKLIASEEELRVQAEELQSSNDELRRNSEALNEQKTTLQILQTETERKASDLERANQYKSQFLANMSHELRTPLNSLLILSQDLAENSQGNLDADQVEAASIIFSSGSNLLRLINEILDLSKIEAGKMDAVLEPVSIPAIAQRMERNFRHVAHEKDVAFIVAIEEGVPQTFVTDDGKLEQITNNLLGNAFKFTAEGSVSVRFAPGAVGGLIISVTDTGIGIPPEKLETIFEAFEQVDSSTRRQFGGTGLGLAISRSLAQLLGGTVEVSSVVGTGTTFTLALPLAGAASTELATATVVKAPEPTLRPAAPIARPAVFVEDDRANLDEKMPTILIVEDDPIFARTLVGIVRRKGYQALAAGDGENGLALARAHKVTGILLDVMLPGMDGWTVIEELKKTANTRHIPVHIVSALDEARRGRDLGAVGFLTKPVTAEDLSGALAALEHFSPDRSRRVLVVDDDADARFAVHKLIAREGTHVEDAASGEEAIAMLEKAPFDCLVLDLGLPGMSGFEVLEQMTARNMHVPVVVYSGRDLTSEESLRLRGFTDSIVIKGAMSKERLLDEVSLFLHSVQYEPKAVPVSPDGDLSGRKLLLVDDDMRNIYALAKILRGKGMDVVLAQDGQKALSQLEDEPGIEIVLMDIMMPIMDGYEAMTEIRKRGRFQKMPIIALTAKAMKDDRKKCIDAGASDYLAKPIDVPRLLSMIRSWLPKR